jgi:hypothetical protein
MPAWVFRVGVAVAVVALALAATDAFLGMAPAPTEANSKRVKPGMKMHEVEAILGGPGRLGTLIGGGAGVQTCYYWVGSGGVVHVWFWCPLSDEGPGIVVHVQFERTASPSPLERLRAWLGW